VAKDLLDEIELLKSRVVVITPKESEARFLSESIADFPRIFG
jgi:hypothetical protein